MLPFRGSLIQPLKSCRFASTSALKEFPSSYTHYQILNIPSSSDESAIKKAFRALSKRYHPDAAISTASATSQLNKKIIKANYLKIISAYKTLTNPTSRKKYDQTLNIKSFTKRSQFKTYSSSGINRSRSTVWQNNHNHSHNNTHNSNHPFATTSTYAGTGSNHDVPHFDFDSHLRGNLWFERRMINKRLHKSNGSYPGHHQNFQKGSNIEDEISYTMNLHRFGGANNNNNSGRSYSSHSKNSSHHHGSSFSYNSGSSAYQGGTSTVTKVLLLSVGLLAVSPMILH